MRRKPSSVDCGLAQWIFANGAFFLCHQQKKTGVFEIPRCRIIAAAPALELRVQAHGKQRYGTTVAVVGGVIDPLIIETEMRSFKQRK